MNYQHAFHQTAAHIYGEWLPKSNYQLDNRAHFEVLEANYQSNVPNSGSSSLNFYKISTSFFYLTLIDFS